ncbi:MAG: glycosyltransferase family 2 protein [Nannocystaceae bacterium]
MTRIDPASETRSGACAKEMASGRVVVTLTAYNEEKNIAPVVRQCVDLGYDVIVVDDGSRDDTAGVAHRHGARVVRHHRNLGQGYALLTSFRAALELDYDIVVEMDADGQHDPAEIPLFLPLFLNEQIDIVVGSRILGKTHDDAPFFRRIFLPHFTTLINVLTGYEMTDALCGFRAFRATSLRRVAPILASMLEPQYIAAEMFIRFSGAGLRVAEVPVVLRNRTSGTSHKGFVRYGLGVLKAILRALATR